MKKFIEKLDSKYLKVCIYAAVTVLLTVGVGIVLLSTESFWVKAWSIFTAVLKPIVIGGIICYLFQPIVNRFERLFNRKTNNKWARSVSVFLTFAIIIMIIGIILLLIAIAVYKNVENLNFDSIKNIFVTLQADYTEVWKIVENLLESNNINTDNISYFVTAATNATTNFFSGLLFGVIFSIYFMLDGHNISKYWTRAFHLIFGQKADEKLKSIMKDADNAFSGYIRGQFLDALIVGVVATIVLSIAGIPYAVVVGVLAGIGNMIPYFGPVVGYVSLALVCLPSGAIDKLVIGIVIFAVVMFVDGNILNPKLLSENVDVHPLLVVAALIAGGAIGGIVGMLVAVPSAAFIKLQFDKYLEKKEEKSESEGKD